MGGGFYVPIKIVSLCLTVFRINFLTAAHDRLHPLDPPNAQHDTLLIIGCYGIDADCFT